MVIIIITVIIKIMKLLLRLEYKVALPKLRYTNV